MRGFSIMSDEERQQIKQQHSKLYDGYAVGNVQSNMTPLTVYDAAQDKGGITVTPNGDVKTYRNHNINEIAAKNLHYDEIDPAYEFDSPGPGDPNLGYDVYNQTLPAYDFDSKGPSDPFYGGGYQTGEEEHTPKKREFSFDMKDFEEYIDDEKAESIHESLDKTVDMFKRFKKFN
jgi:hypothetical protein